MYKARVRLRCFLETATKKKYYKTRRAGKLLMCKMAPIFKEASSYYALKHH